MNCAGVGLPDDRQLPNWVEVCDQRPDESSEDHSSPGEFPQQVDTLTGPMNFNETCWCRCLCIINYLDYKKKYSVCFSYKTCVEEFVKRNHSNVDSVIKAHLFCEQQFRYEYLPTLFCYMYLHVRDLSLILIIRDFMGIIWVGEWWKNGWKQLKILSVWI